MFFAHTQQPDGVVAYRDQFGDPDFNVMAEPFERWMDEHHPQDTEVVSFASWNDSIETAKTNGAIRARYAEEWANYLEDKGCTYRDNC